MSSTVDAESAKETEVSAETAPAGTSTAASPSRTASSTQVTTAPRPACSGTTILDSFCGLQGHAFGGLGGVRIDDVRFDAKDDAEKPEAGDEMIEEAESEGPVSDEVSWRPSWYASAE